MYIRANFCIYTNKNLNIEDILNKVKLPFDEYWRIGDKEVKGDITIVRKESLCGFSLIENAIEIEPISTNIISKLSKFKPEIIELREMGFSIDISFIIVIESVDDSTPILYLSNESLVFYANIGASLTIDF